MECLNKCFEKGAKDVGCIHMLEHIKLLYQLDGRFLRRSFKAMAACQQLILHNLLETPLEKVFVRLLRNDFIGAALLPELEFGLYLFRDQSSLSYFTTNVAIPNAHTLWDIPPDADGNTILHRFSLRKIIPETNAPELHRFYLMPLMEAYLKSRM